MGVDTSTTGDLLRTARQRAGLTQRALADRAGLTQSVISAYESGRRQPSLPTLARLVEASGHDLQLTLSPRLPLQGPLAGTLGRRVQQHRDQITDVAARHGVTNLRIFGSVARGDEDPDSDIDVLADLPPDTGLFTLMRLEAELSLLLDARVEVIPADSLRPDVRPRVERDTVAL